MGIGIDQDGGIDCIKVSSHGSPGGVDGRNSQRPVQESLEFDVRLQ